MDMNQMKKLANDGRIMLETAVTELLLKHPEGLSNSEIASILNLESSHEGNQANYLTYSILGNLMSKGVVSKQKYSPRNVKFFIK